MRMKMTVLAWLLIFVMATAQLAQNQQNDWPYYGNDPGGMRFSPLSQINTNNVSVDFSYG